MKVSTLCWVYALSALLVSGVRGKDGCEPENEDCVDSNGDVGDPLNDHDWLSSSLFGDIWNPFETDYDYDYNDYNDYDYNDYNDYDYDDYNDYDSWMSSINSWASLLHSDSDYGRDYGSDYVSEYGDSSRRSDYWISFWLIFWSVFNNDPRNDDYYGSDYFVSEYETVRQSEYDYTDYEETLSPSDAFLWILVVIFVPCVLCVLWTASIFFIILCFVKSSRQSKEPKKTKDVSKAQPNQCPPYYSMISITEPLQV